jgi:hypothetical protein
VLAFRRERRREPGFIPPASPVGDAANGGGIGYSHVAGSDREDDGYAYGAGGGGGEMDGDAEKESHVSLVHGARGGRRGDDERDVGTYNRYEARMEPAQSAGGAFPLNTGSVVGSDGGEPSRTMRMAYADPCEWG